MHDASKIVLGVPLSSDKVIEVVNASPTDFPAGTAMRIKSDGTFSKATSGSGRLYGISAGKSLSDILKTTVIRSGNKVPVLLTDVKASGTIAITSYANLVDAGDDEITVGGVTFVAQAGAATLGEATFQAATSNGATRDSLLAQINAHPDLEGIVTATSSSTASIIVTADEYGAAGNLIALAYSDEGTATVGATVTGSGFLAGGVGEIGAAVYIDDVSGLADVASGSTISNALYCSGPLTGIKEDGTEAPAILIDMGGGL